MIPTRCPREHSADVIGTEAFFKMEKRASAHSGMSMKFFQKIKIIKSNFSDNPKKNKGNPTDPIGRQKRYKRQISQQ